MENTDAFVRLAGRAINAKVRESYPTSIFTAALVLIGSREVLLLAWNKFVSAGHNVDKSEDLNNYTSDIWKSFNVTKK